MLQSTCYYSLYVTGRSTTYLYDSMTVISPGLTMDVILPLVTPAGYTQHSPGNAAQREIGDYSEGEALVSF